METTTQNYRLAHLGSGKELFKVFITNWLLTIITLGIYYPWAKANMLQYFYSNTTLNEEPFKFSGTGKEMFKGFIKAILIIGLIYGIFFVLIGVLELPLIGMIFFYTAFFALIPFAIHGTLRYRASRSSWRNIRFGYRGELKELLKNCIKWTLFTILTIGFYAPWYEVNLRKYAVGNLRLGNQKFEFKGTGGQYFGIVFIGYFITIITLGIYSFWWIADIFKFYVENTEAYNDKNERVTLKSTLTGGKVFKLLIVNILIIVFTLGFGAPWAITRTYKLYTSSIIISGNINLDAIEQTEADYKNATGEDMGDMLELDIM